MTAFRVIIVVSLLTLLVSACQTTQAPTFTSDGRLNSRVALAPTEYAVNGNSEVLILYIGADDCPPCVRYKNLQYPGWAASEEFGQVAYNEIQFKSYKNTNHDSLWPAEFNWMREKAFARNGAPRWLVSVDRKIVANLKNWNQTRGLISDILARKRAGA